MLPIFCAELQNREANVPGAGIWNTVHWCRPASIGAESMTQFSPSSPKKVSAEASGPPEQVLRNSTVLSAPSLSPTKTFLVFQRR